MILPPNVTFEDKRMLTIGRTDNNAHLHPCAPGRCGKYVPTTRRLTLPEADWELQAFNTFGSLWYEHPDDDFYAIAIELISQHHTPTTQPTP